MDDHVRAKLRALLAQPDRDELIADPPRLAELVRERLGADHRREAGFLVAVLQADVPKRLLAMPGARLSAAALENYAGKVADDIGLREDIVRSAVATWAQALGLAVEREDVPPVPPPPPAPRAAATAAPVRRDANDAARPPTRARPWMALARGATALVILAVLWSIAAAAVGTPFAMPALPAIIARLVQLCGSAAFWAQGFATLVRLVIGYVLALLGIPLGLALAAAPPLRFAAGALVNGLAAAPLIALAPLMVAWFGVGGGAQIALAFVVAVFALTSDVMTGLVRNQEAAGAASEAPGTARCILIAMRRAFLLALSAVLVGEMVGSTSGLGYQLVSSVTLFDVPQTVAILLLVGVPCATLMAIWRVVEEQV